MVTTSARSAVMSGSTGGAGSAARFFRPCGVATDGAGNLYVADQFNHTIRKVLLSSGVVTTLAGTSGTYGSSDRLGDTALFKGPYGVACDSRGSLYVADLSN